MLTTQIDFLSKAKTAYEAAIKAYTADQKTEYPSHSKEVDGLFKQAIVYVNLALQNPPPADQVLICLKIKILSLFRRFCRCLVEGDFKDLALHAKEFRSITTAFAELSMLKNQDSDIDDASTLIQNIKEFLNEDDMVKAEKHFTILIENLLNNKLVLNSDDEDDYQELIIYLLTDFTCYQGRLLEDLQKPAQAIKYYQFLLQNELDESHQWLEDQVTKLTSLIHSVPDKKSAPPSSDQNSGAGIYHQFELMHTRLDEKKCQEAVNALNTFIINLKKLQAPRCPDAKSKPSQDRVTPTKHFQRKSPKPQTEIQLKVIKFTAMLKSDRPQRFEEVNFGLTEIFLQSQDKALFESIRDLEVFCKMVKFYFSALMIDKAKLWSDDPTICINCLKLVKDIGISDFVNTASEIITSIEIMAEQKKDDDKAKAEIEKRRQEKRLAKLEAKKSQGESPTNEAPKSESPVTEKPKKANNKKTRNTPSPASSAETGTKTKAQQIPEEQELDEPSESKEKLPQTIPLPKEAKEALVKLTENSLGKKRAYVVGGLVCDIVRPLGKKTDIDLVFGAHPQTEEEKKDPDFALHLLQKAFPDAVVEKKDKRLFKVIYPENKEESKGEKKESLDIWWSAALSRPELSDEEALTIDTYGGAWVLEPITKLQQLEQLKQLGELKQEEAEQLEKLKKLPQLAFKDRIEKFPELKNDLEEAAGRDFTINSLYVNANEKPYDQTGRGYTDLIRQKVEDGKTVDRPRLKPIISAEKSFAKDPIRALRAIYFASKRNIELSIPLKQKIQELKKPQFENESSANENKTFPRVARVNIVLKKLFTRGDAKRNFELLRETGILEKIFPELGRLLGNKHLTPPVPELHPEVLAFILKSLEKMDQDYKKLVELTASKTVSNEKLHWPNFDKIYSMFIYAVAVMKNRGEPKGNMMHYARPNINLRVISTVKEMDGYYNDHFNLTLTRMSQDLNIFLVAELKQLESNKEMLCKKILEEIKTAREIEISKAIFYKNKFLQKQNKKMEEKDIQDIRNEFEVKDKKREKDIPQMKLPDLITLRQSQIANIINRFKEGRKKKEANALRYVREEWDSYFSTTFTPLPYSTSPNLLMPAFRTISPVVNVAPADDKHLLDIDSVRRAGKS